MPEKATRPPPERNENEYLLGPSRCSSLAVTSTMAHSDHAENTGFGHRCLRPLSDEEVESARDGPEGRVGKSGLANCPSTQLGVF